MYTFFWVTVLVISTIIHTITGTKYYTVSTFAGGGSSTTGAATSVSLTQPPSKKHQTSRQTLTRVVLWATIGACDLNGMSKKASGASRKEVLISLMQVTLLLIRINWYSHHFSP